MSKRYSGFQALSSLSFDLQAGERLAMIGPNGAGKSTCFNLLTGQLRADDGSIRYQGVELVGLPPWRIVRQGIGRTFQIAATFASMTVAENLQLTLLAARHRCRGWWRPARHYFRDEALALLEQVGMAAQADRACGVLAYGDLKRVELAIALAHEPGLLLMDEPTAGMSAEESTVLMTLVDKLVAERRLAVLFTEHDVDVVFNHADRVLVLARGEKIADDLPAQVRADDRVQELYLGVMTTVASD